MNGSLRLCGKQGGEVIDANPDIVGVWAHLHGANFVKEVGHAELALLKMIRGKLGPNVPLPGPWTPTGNGSPSTFPMWISFAPIVGFPCGTWRRLRWKRRRPDQAP